MAFENSPQFDGRRIVARPTILRWVRQRHRLFLALVALLALVDVLLIVRPWLGGVLSLEPGGLDGCLVNARGRPVQASVRVGEVTRETGADGCFFFPELPPGVGDMSVEVGSRVLITQSVEIASGQAASLGEVRIP